MTPGSTVPDLLIKNALVLDPVSGDYVEADIRAHDGRIVEMDTTLTTSAPITRVDAAHRFILPGLIDAHVHVTATSGNLNTLPQVSPTYAAVYGAVQMRRMLRRGFTTVRDVGGADWGLAQAQRDGLVEGPRLLFGGKALSQTGGHGDMRSPGANVYDAHSCCAGIGRVADGVDAVRTAARDELRRGADHIKIMASGGIASPTDRIDSTQYSASELRAAVEEAEAANRYVAAHAYTPRAINRALEAGVRSIEHGNLLDESSIDLFLARDAFLVPTLATYWATAETGSAHGVPEATMHKLDSVYRGGLESLDAAYRSGVKIVFGTDLLGGMQEFQCQEFTLRAEVQKPIDIIRSATTVAADLLQLSSHIGRLTVGAYCDLIILNDNPLDRLSALADGSAIELVIQNGNIQNNK